MDDDATSPRLRRAERRWAASRIAREQLDDQSAWKIRAKMPPTGESARKAPGQTLVVPPAKENAIRAAREAGKGIKAIARDVGVGVSVVQRVVANL